MDGVIVIILAAVLYFIYWPNEVKPKDDIPTAKVVRNPTLNPEMTHDEHAFMKIAYELGFC